MNTEATPRAVREQVTASSPPAWVKGMAALPFGLVLGFTWTALPFLLTRQGVPLGAVAKVSAAVVLPTVWGIFFKPFLDSGLTRSMYCLILTAVASVGLAVGVATLTPAHLGIAVPALATATFSMVLYTGASNGWTSHVTADHERGSVAGWANVAIFGGGSLSSYFVMSLLRHAILSRQGAGVLMGMLVWLAASPLLFFPKAQAPRFRMWEVPTKTLAAIWRTLKRRDCLLGLALFVSPVAGTAAGKLQSGLGKDFHASETIVVWLTGVGSAIAGSSGALLGGWLADRFPRRYLFLALGGATASIAIVTAFLPRTPEVFIATTLVYTLVVGATFAAYNALGLELTGGSPVASTQLGLFAAAINLSGNYMTRASGLGYRHGGVTGLYLVDGLASLACILPLLFLVMAEQRPAAGTA